VISKYWFHIGEKKLTGVTGLPSIGGGRGGTNKLQKKKGVSEPCKDDLKKGGGRGGHWWKGGS